MTRNFTAMRPSQVWVADLTYVLAWVDWFNTRRLLEPIGSALPGSTKRRTLTP